MIIGMQMTNERFKYVVGKMVRANRPCFSEGFTLLGGEMLYLDHVEFGDLELREKEAADTVYLNYMYRHTQGPQTVRKVLRSSVPVRAYRLQLDQAIQIYLVSRAELESSGEHPSENFQVVSIRLIINLALEVNEEGIPSLCASLDNILTMEGKEDLLTLVLKDMLRSEIDIRREFDPALLTSFSGQSAPMIVNAGIAASDDFGRVAIRFDTAPDPLVDVISNWTTFYGGDFADHLFGDDWSIQLPKELFILPLKDKLSKEIVKDPSFCLHEGPFVDWDPQGDNVINAYYGQPTIRITFKGEVIDAALWINVDVTVNMNLYFTVPEPNLLRLTLVLEWNTTEFDPLAVLLAFLGGLISVFCPPLGAVIWFGAIGILGAVTIAEHEVSPMSPEEPPEDWRRLSDSKYYQDTPFPTQIGDLLSGVTLKNIHGIPEGIILSGSMELVDVLMPELVTAVGMFDYKYDSPCHSLIDMTARASVLLIAEPTGVTPRHRLEGCCARILDDPLGQYQIDKWYGPGLSSGRVELLIDGRLLDAFKADPYPCKVLILTQNGARIITLQPPQELKTELSQEENEEYFQWKMRHCWQAGTVFGLIRVLELIWRVDPPPYESVIYLWSVVVKGLVPQELVSFCTFSGQEVMSAVANQRGQAQVNAMLAPMEQATGVYISLNGKTMSRRAYKKESIRIPNPSKKPKYEVICSQTLLTPMAAIPLDTPATEIYLGIMNSATVLSIRTATGVKSWDLSEPSNPRPTRKSVFIWQSTVTDRALNGKVRWREASPSSAQQLVESRNFQTIERALAEMNEAERSKIRQIIIVGRRMVISRGDDLDVLDISQPEAPVHRATLNLGSIRAVSQAQILGVRQAMFVHNGISSGVVLDLDQPTRPRIVARYQQIPWYIGSARAGNVFAKLNDTGDLITVFRIIGENAGIEQPHFG